MTTVPSQRRRITRVALLAALVLAVALTAVWLWTRSVDSSAPITTTDDAAAEATRQAAPNDAAPDHESTANLATQPTGAAGAEDEGAGAGAGNLPVLLPPATFDEQPKTSSASVAVAGIDAVYGEARGPGQVAGPALRFEIEVTPAVDLDLSSVVVTAEYGPDATPAGELSGPNFVPLTGEAASGVPVRGHYVFAVPEDARDDVTLLVTIAAADPVVVFSGPASTS